MRHALLASAALCVGATLACSSSDSGLGGSSGTAGMPAGGATASTGGSTATGTAGSSGEGMFGGAPSGGGGQSAGGSGAFTAGATGFGGAGNSAGAATAGAPSAGAAQGGAANGGAANGGAGSAGAAQGGSAGAAAYAPCPSNGDPCKILPLGDSITWGIQYEGAYRVELFSKALAAGQKITFTGSLSDGPTSVSGVTFPKSNEGHSGWTIAQDTALVPSPAFSTIPNIVLLMIGTNDVYAASGQSTMPDRLGALMDKIFAAAPNALLVVAKITPLQNASWNAAIKPYNDAIPGLVQARAAAGKHVLLADMNTGFTSAMLSSDGIHPNKTGYDFMGDKWYSVLSSLLSK